VTSSCALAIVAHLKAIGQKVLWAPDRHLAAFREPASTAIRGQCSGRFLRQLVNKSLARQRPSVHRFN